MFFSKKKQPESAVSWWVTYAPVYEPSPDNGGMILTEKVVPVKRKKNGRETLEFNQLLLRQSKATMFTELDEELDDIEMKASVRKKISQLYKEYFEYYEEEVDEFAENMKEKHRMDLEAQQLKH